MPRHVAIIMDGNGRWAKNRGLPRLAGHNAGMKAMKKIVDHSDKLGIRYLTVYAFSTGKLEALSGRSVRDLQAAGDVCEQRSAGSWWKTTCKVQGAGRLLRQLPKDAVKSLEKTLEDTKNNTGLQFNIALNYGGRDEIRRSCSDDWQRK